MTALSSSNRSSFCRRGAAPERVVRAGKSWLTELSTNEMREVVTLGADAIDD